MTAMRKRRWLVSTCRSVARGVSRFSRLVLVGMVFTAACSTESPQAPHGNSALLDFLHDGKTTRTEVVENLGEPSKTLESERILTYRIDSLEDGYIINRQCLSGWGGSAISLVLVFDDSAILKAHAMVNIK